MRRRAFLGTATAAVLALAGCGGGDDPAAPAGGGTGGAFPVELEHKYGTTTVKAAPERVAVVGLREQDDLLALGIVPVLITKFAGDDSGIRPWAQAALDGAPEPEAVETTDGIPVEAVAASRPDLIVARFSGMTKDEYDQLSRIAPVVAQPKGVADYGEPWQDEMRAVGTAVGREDDAGRLVREAEAKLAAAREANPGFEGRTALTASSYQGVYVYGPEDPRGRLLADLGFEAPAGIEDVVGDAFGAQLSQERLDLVDVDALVMLLATPEGRKDLEANPVFHRLGVAHRTIYVPAGDLLYNATSAVTVLNVEPILDELVPKLKTAVAAAG